MNRLTGFIASILFVSLSGSVAAEGDIAKGKTLSATCLACHGADGNSVNPVWPKLAGQHPGYLAKQLSEFKDDTRKDATMKGMTAALSEQDMNDLAAYFSTQKTSSESTTSKLIEQGKRIYRGGIMSKGVAACMSCHGPAGDGNAPAGFPALAGQHAAYTVKTLSDFQRGDRVNDVNSMMGKIAFKMTPKEIQAVADYIAALNPN